MSRAGKGAGRPVVVLPGSAWQVPLVERLKAEGFAVYSVNPYADSPTFRLSDGHLQADIFDEGAVEAYCRGVGAEAVMSEECDIAMPVVARLASSLRLRALSERSALLFTDKSRMRELCDEMGFASPVWRRCRSLADLEGFASEFGLPLVVKPLASNSSRGVTIVRDRGALEGAFRYASDFSRGDGALLAERCVEGVEFSCDGVAGPNGHRTLAISRKRHFERNEGVASELYFAHRDAEFDYALLREVNDCLIEASGLEFGLTHVEYKFEDGRFFLIEMAARGGGNLISSHIAPFMSGFDSYGYLIGCYTDGPLPLPEIVPPMERCAVLKFFDCPCGGVVSRIEGIEVLERTPEVAAYRFNFRPGDVIGDVENDAARIGFYIALAESEGRLREVMRKVDGSVRIVTEDGVSEGR